ncbi:MAG TPA: hypothetical protein VFE59_16355, partial [Trebonia sp.]|nr:hypothetical protein [Trebonia sp.]
RTDSYVVTVGVAAFPRSAAASGAHREIAGLARTGGAVGKSAKVAPGIQTARFAGTAAASFRDGQRQISANVAAGTYVVFYTVGYADDRPRERVASDSYTYSEMTSMGEGVARAVVSRLAKPPPPPHCPGTLGC